MSDFFISLLLLGGLTSSPDVMPLWATSGCYDVAPRTSGASGLLQMGMGYDRSKTWQWHWGLSAGASVDKFGARFLPDEAYVGAKWKCLGLDLGIIHKERSFLSCGRDLGSISATAGNMVWSGNAASMPGYTARLHPLTIPFTGERLRLLGTFGDYLTTDRRVYLGALMHNTEAYIELDILKGKDEDGQGRLTISAGLDHYALWGGTGPQGRMSTSLANYFRMITGSPARGGGYGIGDEINVIGSQLGRELLKLEYRGKGYTLVFQHDIPYEDKSGMKFQNFPDGVNTFSFQADDRTRWVSGLVYEYHYTVYQGGTHERREATQEEIDKRARGVYQELDGSWSRIVGGADNYLNNGMYASGWTHHGKVLGCPLFFETGRLSGTYDPSNIVMGVENNRYKAHHLGITGMLAHKLPYKLMATYSMNYGTYSEDKYTGIAAYGLDWKELRKTEKALRQFSAGFQCEVPALKNKLTIIPGIFCDLGQVLRRSVAATIGLRYNIWK